MRSDEEALAHAGDDEVAGVGVGEVHVGIGESIGWRAE